MEQFQEFKEKAKSYIKTADHLAFVTFPLLKDNRLIPSILDNLFLALSNGMNAVLYYDRLFKRVPPFKEDFDSKMQIFKEQSMHRYKLNPAYAALIQEVKEIIIKHKTSPVEFSRGDKFVICDDKYHTETINIQRLKEYISKTKIFIQDVCAILSENEGIFV